MWELPLEWSNTGMKKARNSMKRKGRQSGRTDVYQAPRGSDLDEASSRGVPRGDAQDARASPPSPAWKAGYEKDRGGGGG